MNSRKCKLLPVVSFSVFFFLEKRTSWEKLKKTKNVEAGRRGNLDNYSGIEQFEKCRKLE